MAVGVGGHKALGSEGFTGNGARASASQTGTAGASATPRPFPFSGAELAQAWAGFLSRFEWQWFCTFTFREHKHPEAADKVWRVFVSQLNRSLYGSRWSSHPEGGVYWVRALEWQKREVIHYHALMADNEDLNARASRLEWKEVWFGLAGIARIERPRGVRFVASYCSKYVAKGGEIDLSANLRSYAEQISAVPATR